MPDLTHRLNGWALLGLLALGLPPASSQAREDRHALVVGNNFGGHERVPLLYAEEDARRLADVLVNLGHFPRDQVRLLLGDHPQALLDSITRLTTSAGACREGNDSLVLIFFSGHSDGEHLLMGEERLAISVLREALGACRAEISLIILDACHSGTIVRGKGGHSAPSFLRFVNENRARGQIILTSSSASELAQESDDIGASFFTHYLVSGLMGDADNSGDRRVTLAELYQYVYNRTVHRTVDTLPGTQHPSYSYRLEGEGNLVLTDLNGESTGVFLPEESAGTYLLFDRGRKTVVAELFKDRGTRRLIPLSPGEYTLKKRLHDHLLVGDVELRANNLVTISDRDMKVVPFESPTAKGWDLELMGRLRPWEMQAFASWTAFARAPAGGIWSYPSAGFALSRRGFPGERWMSRLSLGAGGWEHANPVGDRRLAFTLFQLAADLAVGRNLEYGPFMAQLGAKAGVTFIQRRFHDGGYTGTDQTLGGGGGPYALVSIRLDRVRIALELGGGVLLFPSAENVAIPYLSSTLALGFGI